MQLAAQLPPLLRERLLHALARPVRIPRGHRFAPSIADVLQDLRTTRKWAGPFCDAMVRSVNRQVKLPSGAPATAVLGADSLLRVLYEYAVAAASSAQPNGRDFFPDYPSERYFYRAAKALCALLEDRFFDYFAKQTLVALPPGTSVGAATTARGATNAPRAHIADVSLTTFVGNLQKAAASAAAAAATPVTAATTVAPAAMVGRGAGRGGGFGRGRGRGVARRPFRKAASESSFSSSEEESSSSESVSGTNTDATSEDSSSEASVEVACDVCGRPTRPELILLCDGPGCDASIHTTCLAPPLAAVPDTDWFCPTCTRKRARKGKTS